jgi:hypothetical protein
MHEDSVSASERKAWLSVVERPTLRALLAKQDLQPLHGYGETNQVAEKLPVGPISGTTVRLEEVP